MHEHIAEFKFQVLSARSGSLARESEKGIRPTHRVTSKQNLLFVVQVGHGAFAEAASKALFATHRRQSAQAMSVWAAQASQPAESLAHGSHKPGTGSLAALDVCMGAENTPGDTTSLHFDSAGELLLAGMSCGLLALHRWDEVQAWSTSQHR